MFCYRIDGDCILATRTVVNLLYSFLRAPGPRAAGEFLIDRYIMISFLVFVTVVSVSVAVSIPEADASPAAYASDYKYYLPAISPSSQYSAQDMR